MKYTRSIRCNALTGILLFLSLTIAITVNAQNSPVKTPLRVTLLGTGNPRPVPDRYGPSILIEAATSPPTRILIDAGRGSAERLFTLGGRELLSGIDLLLITHLHSDHVVGLPDLWLTGWIFGRRSPLEVRGPEGVEQLTSGLKTAYAFDVHMRGDIDEKLPVEGVEMVTETIRSYSPIEFHGVKITPITVDHGPVKPALGYRIDFGGKSVVLSGDTRYSENLLHAATGCDLLIHEVVAPEVEKRLSQMRDPAATQRVIDHHTTPEQCGKLFRLTHPKLAVYSHIVPSPTRASDLLAPTRKEYAGPLMVGEDLMIFEVGERVSVRKWKVIPSR